MTTTSAAMMRLVVHDYNAYPFTLQLARALAERGHSVLYLYGGGVRPARASTEAHTTAPSRLVIEQVAIQERLRSSAGLGRLLQERRYGRALAERIRTERPDAVLSAPSSLDGQAAALRAVHESGGAFVFWLQDLYSEAIRRLLGRRLPLVSSAIATRFGRLERSLLRDSEAIVAISQDFAPYLRRCGIAHERVVVHPNWAPLDEVRPMARDNDWTREHAIGDRMTFMYAGTLGRKHDPQLLIELSEGVPDAQVVVVSEGAGTDRLRRVGGDRANLRLLPLQPAGRMSQMLASADVLVAILDEDASVFSIPSKVLTYLAAGRPILAAIPSVNLAARTVIEARAGSVVAPSDVRGFIDAAKAMADDSGIRASLGRAGREYAEGAFEIGPIADRFLTVLERAIHEAHSEAVKRPDTGAAR
jgi:glycosyltransferase involved in cell wall biosynthesis